MAEVGLIVHVCLPSHILFTWCNICERFLIDQNDEDFEILFGCKITESDFVPSYLTNLIIHILSIHI